MLRDMSSALEVMNVWQEKQTLTQTHPIADLKLTQSPVQVLSLPIARKRQALAHYTNSHDSSVTEKKTDKRRDL